MTYATDLSLYIPNDVISKESKNAFLKNLIITKIGYFGKAYNHSIYREGISEYVMLYCVKGKGWVEYGGRKIQIFKRITGFSPKNYKGLHKI